MTAAPACALFYEDTMMDAEIAPPVAPTLEELRAVSPALARYTSEVLGELWAGAALAPRERSIVTLAVLIARNQAVELPHHLHLALDHGVSAAEISEIIAHLAFYAGWANASAAVAPTSLVFAARGVRADALPPARPTLLPLDEAAEAQRQAAVAANVGAVAPGVVRYTTDLLFRDLWLRPGLAPRERSLVTVSALVAAGQVAQIAYHLNRAMDNGLTQAQASEAMTQLAFYAGWPNVFSALPVVKDVFEKRPQQA
jgi:4-carboxymuconolactone decarboxylase